MSFLGKHGGRVLVAAVATMMTAAVAFASPTTAGAASMSPVVAHSDDGLMKSKVFGRTDDGRRVKGTFTPTGVGVEDGTLVVEGTLDALLIGKGGKEVETYEDVSIPVRRIKVPDAMGMGGPGVPGAAAGSCDILNLVLGPLDLDVLGLQIHLDKVVLDIVAQSGAGNLLGNLLCQVAGLLDGTSLGGLLEGVLNQLSTLLNEILGALQL
jgi:hypothetical protein